MTVVPSICCDDDVVIYIYTYTYIGMTANGKAPDAALLLSNFKVKSQCSGNDDDDDDDDDG